MVSYIKGGMQAKDIWKQDPEANIWVNNKNDLLIPNEDRKQRQFFEAIPEKGRPRGRPRVTYEECIEAMGRKVSKSMAELKRMAQDRKKWKSFTEDPPTVISN